MRDATDSYSIRVPHVEWETTGPGVKTRRLWTNAANDWAIVMLQTEAGVRLPAHEHRGDTLLYVLEGTLTCGTVRATGGTVAYIPGGCRDALESPDGATVLAHRFDESGDASTEATVSPLLIAPHETPWKPYEPGIQARTLWRSGTRSLTMARLEPGNRSEKHRHVGDEMIYLLEGAVEDEQGVASAGDLTYRPPGCVHTVLCRNGATLLAVVNGPPSEVVE